MTLHHAYFTITFKRKQDKQKGIQMIKLIASDVDGTLVKDGTLMINPEYMTVIHKLVEKGIIFVVCSGRQIASERRLFAPIVNELYYISDGGTVVRTPDKILKTFPMDEELCTPEFIPYWKKHAQVAAAGKEWVDCNAAGANKWTAISYLMEYFGLNADEVCVFGDNLNDIEMLTNAGTSYAVSNARPEVIQAASASAIVCVFPDCDQYTTFTLLIIFCLLFLIAIHFLCPRHYLL